eukprot:COSAG01_NODE_6490_length_3633_cov_24.576401_2_plen_45_part_00
MDPSEDPFEGVDPAALAAMEAAAVKAAAVDDRTRLSVRSMATGV